MQGIVIPEFKPTKSFLDDDVYKLRMAYAAWWLEKQLGREIPVTYRFINRTRSIPLARYVSADQLRDCLNYIRSEIHCTASDLAYINRLGNFDQRAPDFLMYMENLRLPEVHVDTHGDDLVIETRDTWSRSIWWEIKILYTISELFYLAWMKEKGINLGDVLAEGRKRLYEAVALFKQYPGLYFSEFGARRRFSKQWEQEVDDYLVQNIPNQLIGISDMELARDRNVKASGTNAHERGMVYSAVYRQEGILYSHKKCLDDWWNIWGPEFSIALTDLYGSEFFWRNFTPQQMRDWRGFRQDSGPAALEVARGIRWYLKGGLLLPEIKSKNAIPSDGITASKAVELYLLFHSMINISFGMGSFWTNNLGLPNVSMIIKALEADGYPLVKLSDNQAKSLGDSAEIERVKQEVQYDNQFTEQPVY